MGLSKPRPKGQVRPVSAWEENLTSLVGKLLVIYNVSSYGATSAVRVSMADHLENVSLTFTTLNFVFTLF